MGNKGLRRLAILMEKNADPAWINADLYRLMWQRDLYTEAVRRLDLGQSAAPGARGAAVVDLDEGISTIIEQMRTQRLDLGTLRGSEQTLASAHREALIREVMGQILAAIYESPRGPTFKDAAHGLRPGSGRHTALRALRSWRGVDWLVTGTIQGVLTRFQLHLLDAMLRQRISDGRFLDLIWKMLSTSTLALPVAGGDRFSDLLLGVYLHPLDCLMELQQGELAIEPPPPSSTRGRLYHVRHVSDWLLGVCGPRSHAEALAERVRQHVVERMEMATGAIQVRAARSGETVFLGCRVQTRDREQDRLATRPWPLRLEAPVEQIIALLAGQGLCDGSGRPQPRPGWVHLKPAQIIGHYNRLLRGYLDYYSFVDNRRQLREVQYILQHSAARTLAQKLRLSVRKVFHQFGAELAVEPGVSLALSGSWRSMRQFLLDGGDPAVDVRWFPMESVV